MSKSEEQTKKVYAEFEQKVKRTVYLDNLSPKVTDGVIKTALGQFGSVINVEFIPNRTIPYPIPQSALVELENEKQAKTIVDEMTNYPFMMVGMPRPVRARLAKAEMFADRPAPPDRRIQMQWVDPSDPDFEAGMNLKQLYIRHNAEHLAMIKAQLEGEENLAAKQLDVLQANYKKLELLENVMQDGTFAKLAQHYSIKID